MRGAHADEWLYYRLFFDNVYFQKIKVNMFNEIILVKSGFGMSLEIADVGIQPYRLS